MRFPKYWNVDTFDVTSHKWPLSERKNKSFQTSGSDNSTLNTYTYNSLGYRGDEFPLSDKTLMAIGCSHTEGIGVDDNQTWPFYISKKLNHSHINFGFTGRSNDYISRCILTFTEYINPDLVCIMYTYPHRREYYTSNNGIEPYHPSPWGWFEENTELFSCMNKLSNTYDDYINWYKNHLLITNFLENKKIPFIWNGIFLETEYTDDNRFDGDYIIPYGTHATPIQNENYSNMLYEFLTKQKNYGREH